MRKNFAIVLIVLFSFGLNYRVQAYPSHSDLRFLNLDENIYSSWYGPAAWTKDQKFIQFEYADPKHGWARIIFYGKTLNDKRYIDALIKTGYTEKSFQPLVLENLARFNVWAIFVDKKYDSGKEDAGDMVNYTPNYPCTVELFKLDNKKWRFVRSENTLPKGNIFNLFPQTKY